MIFRESFDKEQGSGKRCKKLETKAVNNQTGEASIYEYNGLGHRVGKTIGNLIEPSLPTDKLQNLTINPTKQIEDTIDLTKQYHNLLQRREDNNTTAYTWDSNVLHAVGGEERNTSEQNHYQYLQDELGSPIRLLTGDGIEQEVYGYDEFGAETIESNNSREFMQPFTYTGYQRDSVANTYFAQAREYQAGVGRFAGEDIIKGNVIKPFTLNQYVYCLNQPFDFVDLDGEFPQWIKDAGSKVADFWNTHIYGEEIIVVNDASLDGGMVYSAGRVTETFQNPEYTGRILVRTATVSILPNGSEQIATGMAINIPGGMSFSRTTGADGVELSYSYGINIEGNGVVAGYELSLGGPEIINLRSTAQVGLRNMWFGIGGEVPLHLQNDMKLFGFSETISGNRKIYTEGGVRCASGGVALAVALTAGYAAAKVLTGGTSTSLTPAYLALMAVFLDVNQADIDDTDCDSN